MYNTRVRGILIKGNKSYDQVTREILTPIYAPSAPTWWKIAAFVATVALLLGVWLFHRQVNRYF